jgi:glycosyltransferase involved in cell wall biosynthesis
MSNRPDISVVMSVYNGANDLRETIDSILVQEGVELELIIINDGSTDGSEKLLNEYANRDLRVRVFHQENQGLTRSLINGCAEARGIYIARQDAGDISLPNRLIKQLTCIKENPDAGFVSCGVRYVGPGGEYLYDISHDPSEATSRLKTLELAGIRGPAHHGSTLFSRALYEQIGGYRSAFYFAQDLDLWIRLVECGQHVIIPEILYQASITLESISSLYRKEQVESARLILESARLRRESRSEEPALDKARLIRPLARRSGSRLRRARAFYFIGVCLKSHSDPKAPLYFKQALQAFPLHLKSAVQLLLR